MVDLNNILSLTATSLPTFIAMASVVERATEVIKNVCYNTTHKEVELNPVTKEALSLAIGCILCVSTGTQAYGALNVPPVVNQLLAGVIVSLGSNFLHQALSIVIGLKDNIENKALIDTIVDDITKPIDTKPVEPVNEVVEEKKEEVPKTEATPNVVTVDEETLAKAISIALKNINNQ